MLGLDDLDVQASRRQTADDRRAVPVHVQHVDLILAKQPAQLCNGARIVLAETIERRNGDALIAQRRRERAIVK